MAVDEENTSFGPSAVNFLGAIGKGSFFLTSPEAADVVDVVEELVVTFLPDGEIVMVRSVFTLQGFLFGGSS